MEFNMSLPTARQRMSLDDDGITWCTK